ncbi:ABC transporter substrate-binding protein [Paenibacillus sp. CF384]|uniref:ABC transporter substrate-binding protein n=1 Tax=Paenibacillus sp. CF384 TaxID=1884382 RepID=UPI0008992B72|nr:ABC transporter substrate-binding protein [Paenibacillus sp. CF384]SDX06758.1 carbohydrate ABC transporter substrate-binding protein, CUT1 family [Paenibacillus sp. CF384]
MKMLLSNKKLVSFMLVLMIIIIMLSSVLFIKGTRSSSEAIADLTDLQQDSKSTAKHGSSPVTISFWFPWGGGFQKEFHDTVVVPFEKANPDIKVKMRFVENSDNSQASDKLLTAIAGGRAPDVAMLDRFLVSEWAAMGALEDLSSDVTQDGMASLYYPNIWPETQYNNKTFALPWNVDSRAMLYNKTMMEEAGLDPNKPPTTIAELDAMAEKMFSLNKKGNYEQVGFVPWMAQGFLYANGWNFGGQWENHGELTPNNPENVQALEWMQSYAKKYDPKKLASFSDTIRQAGVNPFASGKVGFIYEGNWLLNDLDDVSFDWGIAPMPTQESGQSVTWAGGWSFAMPSGAKHKEQAWRFIKYVAGIEGSYLWAGRGQTYDLSSIPEVNKKLGLDKKKNLEVFVNLLDHAYIRPVSPIGGYMWDELYRVQKLAVNLQGEPKALLAELKRKLDAHLIEVKAEERSKTEHPTPDTL